MHIAEVRVFTFTVMHTKFQNKLRKKREIFDELCLFVHIVWSGKRQTVCSFLVLTVQVGEVDHLMIIMITCVFKIMIIIINDD